MTHLDPNADGGNAYVHQARALAEQADAEAAARHPNLARANAELALVFLDLAGHAPAGHHGTAAWQAAEDARHALSEGRALPAEADTVRARMHLALDRLDPARH